MIRISQESVQKELLIYNLQNFAASNKIIMICFKVYQQYDAMDCGPTCLHMAVKHHGRS